MNGALAAVTQENELRLVEEEFIAHDILFRGDGEERRDTTAALVVLREGGLTLEHLFLRRLLGAEPRIDREPRELSAAYPLREDVGPGHHRNHEGEEDWQTNEAHGLYLSSKFSRGVKTAFAALRHRLRWATV
jgi:hypothetical protein